MKNAIAFLASVAVLGTSVAAVPVAAQSAGGNVAAQSNRADRAASAAVLKWHEIMLDTHARSATPGETGAGQNGGPLRTTRGFAMTMISVFDAVNAFDQKYRSYSSIAAAQNNASKEVAIAYAAHDVLTAVWNGQIGRAHV